MAKGNNLNTASTGPVIAPSDFEEERSADEIRQDIAARRESITDTVDRLGDRFQETLDWRTYVGKYPLIAIGVAAGLGIIVSGVFKPRPSPADRIKDAFADSLEDITDRVKSQLDSVAVRKPGFNQAIKATATGLLVKAATEFIRNRAGNYWGQHIEEEDDRNGYRYDAPRAAVPYR